MKVRSRASMRGGWCAVIALAAATTAPAGSIRPAPQIQQLSAIPEGVQQIREAMAGTVVAVDPVTGEMRMPTQAEHDALTEGRAAAPRFAAPQIIQVPGGGELLMTSPATIDFLTAVAGPDGRVSMRCTHGFDASSSTFRADHANRKERRDDR